MSGGSETTASGRVTSVRTHNRPNTSPFGGITVRARLGVARLGSLRHWEVVAVYVERRQVSTSICIRHARDGARLCAATARLRACAPCSCQPLKSSYDVTHAHMSYQTSAHVHESISDTAAHPAWQRKQAAPSKAYTDTSKQKESGPSRQAIRKSRCTPDDRMQLPRVDCRKTSDTDGRS